MRRPVSLLCCAPIFFTRGPAEVPDPPRLDPHGHTAVFVVGSSRSGGVYALEWVRREFPGEFRNCVFMNVRTVDAHVYGGGEDFERIKQQVAAKAYLTFGTDPIEELTNLAEKIYREFPHSIFSTSKLIFERDNWYIRQLHSEAALTMLRRLHLRNMPMVILPMKL